MVKRAAKFSFVNSLMLVGGRNFHARGEAGGERRGEAPGTIGAEIWALERDPSTGSFTGKGGKSFFRRWVGRVRLRPREEKEIEKQIPGLIIKITSV